MNDATPPRRSLRLEGILALLPTSDVLRPLLDHLVEMSRPDPARRWSVGGELGTAGTRLVDMDGLRETGVSVARTEARRVERHLQRAVAVIAAAAEGRGEGVVEALLEEVGALEGEGRLEDARAWAEAAVRETFASGSSRGGEALRLAARCARGLGDLQAARSLYEEAHLRSLALGRRVDAVIAATGRGNVAVDQGRWEEAEEWYGKALTLIEEGSAALPPAEARGLRWRLYQNLGITNRERGAFDSAEGWYRRAAETSGAAGVGARDPAADVEVENGWGQLELARGELRKAELRFRRALAALGTGRGGEGSVAVRVNLGEALLRQGRTLEAGEVGREAEAEALRGGWLRRVPEIYRLLAGVAHARGETEAFVFLDRALALVRERGLPPYEEALTLETLAGLRDEEGEVEAGADAREAARRIFRRLGVRLDPNEDQRSSRKGEGDEP